MENVNTYVILESVTTRGVGEMGQCIATCCKELVK